MISTLIVLFLAMSHTIWKHEDGNIVIDNSSTLQHLYITNTQSNSGRYSCIAGLENGKVIAYSVDVVVEGKIISDKEQVHKVSFSV